MTNKSTVLDESIAQPHAELLHAKKKQGVLRRYTRTLLLTEPAVLRSTEGALAFSKDTYIAELPSLVACKTHSRTPGLSNYLTASPARP